MNIPSWILKLLGQIGRFISVLVKGAVKKELEVVLPIAAGAVRSVASDTTILKSSDKRATAFGIIMGQLAAAQLEVGLSVINLAIELAVQEFKANEVTQVAPIEVPPKVEKE